ncbi:MAG: acyclic terpene utilization AtuA family protein [Planctomycetota bacterium]
MSQDAKTIRIGNGAGFWGDNLDAPKLLAEHGKLDYLTLEYLAELTLSILAHQRTKKPDAGFVTDVPTVVRDLVPFLDQERRRLKLVTNGGGMNPVGCARATSEVLVESGLPEILVGAVSGDDLMPRLNKLLRAGETFENFETGEPLGDLSEKIVSANVYLGYKGIADALAKEAQIVLTGRIADAALVVGPAMHEFGWQPDDWERLGGATVAGHLIECGAQVTGGMYSDWDESIDLNNIGYPIAELIHDGTCLITKPRKTGGTVTIGTVAEQLVYEIGDPTKYFTPDVVADFSHVRLEQDKANEVLVSGGTGTAAPDKLKVSMAYYDGFATTGMIVVTGRNAEAKATAAGRAIKAKMNTAGFELDEFNVELLGAGATLPGMDLWHRDAREIVLRISARDQRRQAIDRLTRELAPLVTSGPPGVTGYTGARARTRPVISYWPSLIDRSLVESVSDVKSAAEWLL